MNKQQFNKREVIRFKRFSRKGYSLFSCLGRVVIVGTLSVPTIAHAKANSISIRTDMADEDRPQYEVTLDDVEVSGSRAPLALGQAAKVVTVLTRDEIQAAPAQSINDLLKMVTGADVRQRGPIGAQTDISLRGGTQEQITILLNGINICDPQTGHNAFDFPVDLSDIERIEVLEGAAARVFGTSSLLGAINIVTRKSSFNKVSQHDSSSYAQRSASETPRSASLDLHIEGGSFGYLSAGGGAGYENGRWNHRLSGSYTRSDGYSRSTSGRLNSDYHGGKAFYQGRFDDSSVTVDWYAGVSSKGYGSNTFYSAKYDDQYERTTKLYSAVQAETKGWFHFRPSVYWNRSYDRFELIRDNADACPFNYHRSDVFGVNLNSWFDWMLGRTAVGAEFRNEDVISGNLGELLNLPKHIHGTDRDYEYGINRSNISFFVEHNVLLRRFTLSAGFTAVKNTWNEMNFRFYPGVDASYRLADNWKVFASWNTSLRMPSVTELYYSVGGRKADKYLKPEELSAVEIGIKYVSPALSASISGFYHHGRNMIDWILDTSLGEDAYWQSMNHTRLNTLGFETQCTADLRTLLSGQKILRRFTVSYAYLSQDKDLEEGLQSMYALEYLRHKLVSKLELHIVEALNAGIQYRFQDRTGTYTTASGDVKNYCPYALWDVRLSWDKPRYSLYAEINNVFNKKDYVDYGNVPQPGLWFTTGTRIRL